jgi:uncharacterized membrane protein
LSYTLTVLVHVLFGILWAGGSVALGLFVIPAVIEAGPNGGPVMGGIVKRKLPQIYTGFAVLTVLSGLFLLHVRSAGNPAFWGSTEGIVLSVGALLGLGAFGIGVGMQRPAAMGLGALGAQIAAQGTPPTAEQGAQMAALRAKLGKAARLQAFHVLAAALCMAAHRFFQ